MGRFGSTGAVDVPDLEHSIVDLRWGILRGKYGPSDGSVGAKCNVPSALSVVRHAVLYLSLPDEIDEAFSVLERHAIDRGQLYPVAVTIVPFLLDTLRRGVPAPVDERVADVIALYAGAATTLEDKQLASKLLGIVGDHARAIVGWLGRFDRALAALAIHVPALREPLLAELVAAPRIAPEILLALAEFDAIPPKAIAIAHVLLDGADSSDAARMAGAAFLARHGDGTPELQTRIDAALPPSAQGALRAFVRELWSPTIARVVVAPKLLDAEVVFCGEKLVLVRAGVRTVTLPWAGATVMRGDRLKVGITAHGQPKLVMLTGADGLVRVIDLNR
jgi:hypothetical protein